MPRQPRNGTLRQSVPKTTCAALLLRPSSWICEDLCPSISCDQKQDHGSGTSASTYFGQKSASPVWWKSNSRIMICSSKSFSHVQGDMRFYLGLVAKVPCRSRAQCILTRAQMCHCHRNQVIYTNGLATNILKNPFLVANRVFPQSLKLLGK